MKNVDIFRLACASFKQFRVRNSLAALGIAIATLAVIVIPALGEIGVKESERILEVEYPSPRMFYSALGFYRPGEFELFAIPFFTENDVHTVRALDGIIASYPVAVYPNVVVKYEEKEVLSPITLYALSEEGLESLIPAERFLFGGHGNNAIILGYRSSIQIFGSTNVVGKNVSIILPTGTFEAQVSGVLQKIEETILWRGADPNLKMYAPLDVLPPVDRYNFLLTIGEDERVIEAIKENVILTLKEKMNKENREIAPGLELLAMTKCDARAAIRAALGDLERAGLAIATVSFIVGLIVITSAMLTVVYEEVYGIALMTAVGAGRIDISRYILTISALIGLSGVLVGAILSIPAIIIVSELLGIGIWVLPSFHTVAITAIVGLGLAITAGFYPAYKASRLEPSEVLRYGG
jgi:ABC-type antimicrobial peptide transport system permease subunit